MSGFEVTTIKGEYLFGEATAFERRKKKIGPPFLVVIGDDGCGNSEEKLRTFNLDYVIDYGWSE